MKKNLTILLSAFLLISFTACSSTDTTEESTKKTETTQTKQESSAETHIYDDAQTVDSLSGSGDKIGEVSIIKASSTDVTDEALEDWYFNYVEKNNFDYCIILYKDKENIGVHAIKGMVTKDIKLQENEDGTYSNAGDTKNTTLYTPNDGKLVK